ncbi:hypothetical protein [Deinococcus marmoris]|uniref:hypothetical protein n=1 Tax=Deinococcus marmoris TaxID=249408 RepID=UPI00049813CB|nr:hypothetical protein [Deinococcus marmoris]
MRYALKRQLLEVQEQGHKIRMEDVLEALILRYVEDAAFRAEVTGGGLRIEEQWELAHQLHEIDSG